MLPSITDPARAKEYAEQEGKADRFTGSIKILIVCAVLAVLGVGGYSVYNALYH